MDDIREAQPPRPIYLPPTGSLLVRPRAIIFDMDGTLVNVDAIRHYVNGISNSKRNFDAFHRESVSQPPHHGVVEMARLAKELGFVVIVVTARSACYAPLSSFWLAMHDVPCDVKYHREDGDVRPDWQVKSDILDDLSRRFDVVHAVDDNPQVLSLWRERGISVTDVGGWPDENGQETPVGSFELPEHVLALAPAAEVSLSRPSRSR